MESFQKQEEQRINLVKESVMRILISEISCIRNLQYDVDKIAKVCFREDFLFKFLKIRKLKWWTLTKIFWISLKRIKQTK